MGKVINKVGDPLLLEGVLADRAKLLTSVLRDVNKMLETFKKEGAIDAPTEELMYNEAVKWFAWVWEYTGVEVENQHRKISGYRELSELEIEMMNTIKSLAAHSGDLMTGLANAEDTDKRCVALAKTKFQEGYMWAVRSVAKPEGFG